MRTSLPLGCLLVGLAALAGCSESENNDCLPGDPCNLPPPGGAGGQVGGGGTAGMGTAGTNPIGGGGSAGTGGAGGGGSSVNRGEVIELVPATATDTSLPFSISGEAYGIQGASFVDRSAQGNTLTVTTGPAGELCVEASLEAVPDAMSYGTHWGLDLGFNLNQATTPVGGGDADAGADAGATGGGGGELPPLAWIPPANVIGFSFVAEGADIDLIRFRARPAGLDPALETSIYCKSITAAVSGQPTDVLFTEVWQQCWNNMPIPAPTANGFDRISWNLPADVGVTRTYNFCIKDIRPILAP